MPAIHFTDGRAVNVSNIFCIGRNYAAHAAELGNAIEAEPMVFLKPTSALLEAGCAIHLPAFSQDIHHECEVVLLIGKGGRDIPLDGALSHIAGYAMGLDLTARDLQTIAKQKGHPWTVSKGFDGSACVSAFIDAAKLPNPDAATFSLDVNGQRRQTGDCHLMIHSYAKLISYVSSRFTLQAGDLIYTGTPEGVAAIKSGDQLTLRLDGLIEAAFSVA